MKATGKLGDATLDVHPETLTTYILSRLQKGDTLESIKYWLPQKFKQLDESIFNDCVNSALHEWIQHFEQN